MLVSQKGYIFVAGNSKNMPQTVREAFVNIVKERNKISDVDAENFFSKLERLGQYQTETWS